MAKSPAVEVRQETPWREQIQQLITGPGLLDIVFVPHGVPGGLERLAPDTSWCRRRDAPGLEAHCAYVVVLGYWDVEFGSGIPVFEHEVG